MSEIWGRWEGELIGGIYPLRRLLSGSDHCGVFLGETAGETPSDVAIKPETVLPFTNDRKGLVELPLCHQGSAMRQ